MSERIPAVEDIRQALRGDGWTLDEADEGIDRIKQRGIGIGHEMARETMQASIGDAVRKLQEIAWDEGHARGRDYQGDGWNADALREALRSDEAVERAARALYETDRKEYDGDKQWPPWPQFIADMYRERARAALTAAIGGGDE